MPSLNEGWRIHPFLSKGGFKPICKQQRRIQFRVPPSIVVLTFWFQVFTKAALKNPVHQEKSEDTSLLSPPKYENPYLIENLFIISCLNLYSAQANYRLGKAVRSNHGKGVPLFGKSSSVMQRLAATQLSGKTGALNSFLHHRQPIHGLKQRCWKLLVDSFSQAEWKLVCLREQIPDKEE